MNESIFRPPVETAEPVVMASPASGPAIRNVAERLCTLPLFRPTVIKTLQVLAREDAEINEFVKLIQSDPAFSADILLLANSSLFGFSSRISSVGHAVTVLGLERTRALTLAIAMRAQLRGGFHTPVVRRCWLHSLVCAQLAEELAPRFGIDRDRAYTAGLIHDIGRLGLVVAYPSEYKGLLSETYPSRAAILEAERRLFEMDHAQAGMWLTRVWSFPQEFWEITGQHHESSSGRGSLALIQLACLLADALEFDAVRYRPLVTTEEIQATLPCAPRVLAGFDRESWMRRIRDRAQLLDVT